MRDLPLTRQSLILRLKDRSDEAWNEFLTIYETALLEFAKRKGLQEADALDVTQEVLAALEKKLPDWETDIERGKLRGWLFRVARNMAVDKIAERSKSPLAFGGLQSSGVENLISDTEKDSVEFLNHYRKKLLHWAAERIRKRVNAKTWRAFWLTAMEGKPPSDVAKQLGLSSGNVYAAKFRVTERIQKLVNTVSGLDESEWPGFEEQS